MQPVQLDSGALLAYRYSGSGYPGSPSVTIPFQINPERIERTISVSTSASTESRTSVIKLTRVPEESINATIRLDAWNLLQGATDQRGRRVDTDVGQKYGVLPHISAIETLVFPTSSTIDQARNGKVLISHPMPLVVFRWGVREVPVSIKSIGVQEEVFGDGLFPIQAQVTLSMTVLSSSDVDPSHPAFQKFVAYLKVKEDYAAMLPPSGG